MMTPRVGEPAEHTRFQFHKVTTSQPRYQIDPGCQRCQQCFMQRAASVALLPHISGREHDRGEDHAERERRFLCP